VVRLRKPPDEPKGEANVGGLLVLESRKKKVLASKFSTPEEKLKLKSARHCDTRETATRRTRNERAIERKICMIQACAIGF
jgi:hypothetical protein